MAEKKAVVFLSGPINGTPEYREKFAAIAVRLEAMGHPTINPATLPQGMGTHRDYMDLSFAMIDKAGIVVQLDGWEQSPGANQEYGYARATRKLVMPVACMLGIMDSRRDIAFGTGEGLTREDVRR